jgi:hypothetical protein
LAYAWPSFARTYAWNFGKLEVATGELGVELRELIAELRTEFARLTELGRRLASLATETAGLHLRGAYQSDQDYDRW